MPMPPPQNFSPLKYSQLTLPFTATWGILMSADHPLTANTGIGPEDLKAFPLIIPQNPYLQKLLSEWMSEDLQNLNIFASCNMDYSIFPFVKKGLACALSPSFFHVKTDRSISFKPVSYAGEITYHLVWKRRQPLSKAAEIFLENARGHCSKSGNISKANLLL